MEITPEYLSSLEKIGKGACADVYKYGDKALKVLNESGKAMVNLQETSKLVGIKNDTFILPEEILTGADGEVIGYILELVDGQAFIDDNIIKNIDFDTFLANIAEEKFGKEFSSLQEIEQAIQKSEIQQEDESKIVSFEEYKNSKQQITEQQTESIGISQIGIKQKIANFLADKTLLRKIPFIDRFVSKEQRLLPETTQEQREDKQTAHSKFEDEISGHGKYKNLFLGKPVKNVSLEMNRQKIPEAHSMADPEKIAQMKKEMDGKSLEDDL